jgi:large subunit ribosomal protein L7/L12
MSISTNELIEAFGNMTVMEMVELTKALEERFQVKAATNVVAQTTQSTETKAEDQADKLFSVRLDNFGANKISVVKIVRETLGIGLKETADLVNKAPVVLQKDMEKNAAESFATRLTAAGGTVTVE